MTAQFIGKETIPCFSLFTISAYRLHDQHKVCMGFSCFVTNLYPPEPFSTLCMENHSPHTAQSRNATHSGLSSGTHPTWNETQIPPLVSRHHVIHARPALQAPVYTSPLHSTLLLLSSHTSYFVAWPPPHPPSTFGPAPHNLPLVPLVVSCSDPLSNVTMPPHSSQDRALAPPSAVVPHPSNMAPPIKRFPASYVSPL